MRSPARLLPLLTILSLASACAGKKASDPKDPCDRASIERSSLPIGLDDPQYLLAVMGMSYGGAVSQFIPGLRSASSNMLYRGAKDNPQLTYFRAEYKTPELAKRADKYLRSRWLGNRANQYDVVRIGDEVVWFGNNRFTKECFYDLVDREIARLQVDHPANKIN